MTARAYATRAEVIHAAALLAGDELPATEQSEYMRGICELIADAFGTDDAETDPRAEVWREIQIMHESIGARGNAR